MNVAAVNESRRLERFLSSPVAATVLAQFEAGADAENQPRRVELAAQRSAIPTGRAKELEPLQAALRDAEAATAAAQKALQAAQQREATARDNAERCAAKWRSALTRGERELRELAPVVLADTRAVLVSIRNELDQHRRISYRPGDSAIAESQQLSDDIAGAIATLDEMVLSDVPGDEARKHCDVVLEQIRDRVARVAPNALIGLED